MKYLALILTLITSQGWASGYYCSGLCIAIDAPSSVLYIGQEMEVKAGVKSAAKAHRMLKKKCRLYFGGDGLLVDNLRFKSSKTDESESSSYMENYYQSSSSADSTHYSDLWSSYQDYSIKVSSSSYNYESHYSREYTHRALDVDLMPSRKEISCEKDGNIIDGYLPYPGNLPIQ